MSTGFAIVCAVGGAALTMLRSLVSAEVVGRIPRHCERVIEAQVRRLPAGERDLMREVWLGELAACDQRPLSALWWAHVVVRRGSAARAREVARVERGTSRVRHVATGPGRAVDALCARLLDSFRGYTVEQVCRSCGPDSAARILSGYLRLSDVEADAFRGALSPDVKLVLRKRRAEALGAALERLVFDDTQRLALEAELNDLLRVIDSAERQAASRGSQPVP